MISVYVIQIILILVFGFLFRGEKKKFLTTAFIILFVVMAFRNARLVGDDSATSYYIEFSEIEKSINFEISWPNPGLSFVMRLILFVSNDYQWVIVITALWICFAYCKLLIKYSEGAFISVMWFMGMLFYTFMFSALKQAWAMAFLCFAFDSIFEKKPIRFLLFVSLAALFHFPALIFLPAYLIAKLRINKVFPIMMLSIIVIVYIFRAQILSLMTSTYAKGEGEYLSNVQFIGTKFVFMLLMIAFGFYNYFNSENNKSQKDNVNSALLYFMAIAAVIQTFCFYSNIFERLADYYFQFSILFVPLVLLQRGTINLKKGDQSLSKSAHSQNVTIGSKSSRIISLKDIDIITALSIIITVFCVWRYISTTVNDVALSPFYFFWQNLSGIK